MRVAKRLMADVDGTRIVTIGPAMDVARDSVTMSTIVCTHTFEDTWFAECFAAVTRTLVVD